MQEVCCTLIDRIVGYRGKARCTTWLFGITANACRDHRRRGATLVRMRQGLAVLVGAGWARNGADRHRRAWLGSSLNRLEPGLHDAVVLVASEGLTYAEAGPALGVAETTMAWRLFEARGDDPYGYRSEVLQLVRAAKTAQALGSSRP